MTKLPDPNGRDEPPPLVLVVEDHRDTRDMYEALLNAEGFWVLKVGDAVEAFEYARDFHPDAVLTDLGWSGESDGANLIRRLRKNPEFEFTPVIAVTARQERELAPIGDLRISALLVKPVSPNLLIDQLNAALHKSAVLRARSRALLERIPVLVKRSQSALRRSQATPRTWPRQRPCPRCGRPLTWARKVRQFHATYDHYEPCAHGCGEWRFNRSAHSFEDERRPALFPGHVRMPRSKRDD